MRISFAGPLTLIISLWAGTVAAGTSTGKGFQPKLFGALPECASSCLDQIAQNFACDADSSCVCTDGSLIHSLDNCFTFMCTSLEAGVALKVHSLACDSPIRNRAPLVNEVTISLFVVATIMMILRVLARCPWIGGPGFGYDDYVALLSYVFSTGMVAFEFVLVANGSGKDFFNLTISKIDNFMFYFFIDQTFYSPAIFLSKASMVLLYTRTWPSYGRWTLFHVICWFTFTCIILAMLISVMIGIFYCDPIDTAWSLDKQLREQHCLDLSTFAFATGAVSIFLDIVVLMLPIAKLVELPISLRQRIGLCSVFMAGVIVTAIAIVRLKYVTSVSTDVLNVTYEFSLLGMWTMVEILVSIICICMPAATGFMRKLWGPRERFQSRSRSSDLEEDQLQTLADSRASIRGEGKDGKGFSPSP